MSELQRRFTSEEFAELRAFKRLYTWEPDLWYGLQQAAWVIRGGDIEDFVPVKRKDDEERRQRRIAEAEERMDRDAEER